MKNHGQTCPIQRGVRSHIQHKEDKAYENIKEGPKYQGTEIKLRIEEAITNVNVIKRVLYNKNVCLKLILILVRCYVFTTALLRRNMDIKCRNNQKTEAFEM